MTVKFVWQVIPVLLINETQDKGNSRIYLQIFFKAEAQLNKFENSRYSHHQRPLHHNFIDFKKTFDGAWHKALCLVKQKCNISDAIIIIQK